MQEAEVMEKRDSYTICSFFNFDKKDLVFLELNKEKVGEIYQSLKISDKEAFVRKINHPFKGEVNVYEAFYLGYFSSNDIKGYFCGKCNKEYNEKPLQEILIELPDELFPKHMGKFYLKCNHCDNYVLHSGIIREGDKVDPKFIVEDRRGLFIPKTEKDVNDKLDKLLEEAKKGLKFIRHDEVMYWANNLKLDISKKLNEIEQIREESYFSDYQRDLPKIIKQLEEHSEFVGRSHPILSSGDDPGMTYEEGSGFYEIWDEFVKYLPKLGLTSELKQKTLEILSTIKSNVKHRNKVLKTVIEEKAKELNKAVTETKKEVKEYESLEKLVRSK